MVVNRHATPANASTDAADRDAEMAPDDNNDKPLLPTSAAPSFEKKKSLLSMEVVLVLFYGAMNLGSASGIVLVNKAVFHTCGFHFPIALIRRIQTPPCERGIRRNVNLALEAKERDR